jgi:hypothetical protein
MPARRAHPTRASALARLPPEPTDSTAFVTSACASVESGASVAPRQGVGRASGARRENTKVQRSVEVLVGRLITDEEFRRAFQRDPRGTLQVAAEWGLELTAGELQALVSADHGMWERFAEEIDARLQKASLRNR